MDIFRREHRFFALRVSGLLHLLTYADRQLRLWNVNISKVGKLSQDGAVSINEQITIEFIDKVTKIELVQLHYQKDRIFKAWTNNVSKLYNYSTSS